MSWIELEPLLCQVGIIALLAISLNVLCGMTGLLQLGHAGFYAMGAYGAGLYSIYFTIPALGWFNLVPATMCGMLAASVCAVIIGIPCLRLRGDYLAIATLGFGEIVRLLLTNIEFSGGKMFEGDLIGGPTGISFTEFPEELWGDAYVDYAADHASLGVIWVAVIVVYILLRNIKHSAIGRAFMSIREDQIAARAMGINVPRYKMTAFVISSAFAGMAGSLFFHHHLRASPGDFSLLHSISILLIVVLGGMGSLSGSIIAAIILGLTPHMLRHVDFTNVQWLPDVMQRSMGEFTAILYALLLIILIRLMPEGIMRMNEMPAWMRRWRKYPK